MPFEHALKLPELPKVALLHLAGGDSRPELNDRGDVPGGDLRRKGGGLKAVVLNFKLERLRFRGGESFVIYGLLLLEGFDFILDRPELLSADFVLRELLVGKGGTGAGFVKKVYCFVREAVIRWLQ